MVMAAAGAAASFLGDALGLMKPTKAKLVCKDDNLPDGYAPLEVMFNPTEYTLTTAARVNRTTSPATPGGTAQFAGTDPITLRLRLFLDAYSEAEGDVTPKVSTLIGWTYPTGSTARTPQPMPPRVGLEWGNRQLEAFFGHIKSLSVTYSLFRMDGTPVRAMVDLSIEGENATPSATNPTSHALDSRRIRTLTDGDTLQSIAYRELGKAAAWRAIAELNGIDDPQRVQAGSSVLIPTRADASGNR
jgi:hypothetical protein